MLKNFIKLNYNKPKNMLSTIVGIFFIVHYDDQSSHEFMSYVIHNHKI